MIPQHSSLRTALLCAGLAAVLPSAARSQTTAANPDTSTKDVVTLPQFTINEKPANPYVSRQALSASRVAMDLQDIPQSVSIVTSEFMKDSMSNRMLDAAKYITPVTESSLPTGSDRYNMRGFQTSHEFIDGMVISGEDGYSMSIVPYNIDRVEIIKGPNAILVPGGAPGGQFNPITKSPIMKDQASVTLELSQYVGNAISTDYNRIISREKGLAARVVAAYWNSGGYSDRYFRKGWMFAPSLSWQLSPDHKLTVKAEIMRNKETNGTLLPLDPANGSNDYATVARGLPRNFSFGNDNDFRDRKTERITMELLSTLNEHLTSRLQLTGDHISREDQGGTNATVTNAGGGSVNPFTGLYQPGVNWNTAAYNADTTGTVVLTGTSVPVTDPSTWVYTRLNNSDHLYYTEAHFRNDYALKFESEWWKSTTISGVAANASRVRWKSYANVARTPVANNNLGAITFDPRIYLNPPTVDNKSARESDLQLYVYENASFFKDVLQLSVGLSRYFGNLTRTDSYNVPAVVQPSLDIATTAKSYGVVVKPIKEVSFFWSRNDSGQALPGSLSTGDASISTTGNPAFKPSVGTQDEFGVKSTWLDGKLTASFAHFSISQTNQQVPNSDWYNDPTLPKYLYLDIKSKGWEFESTYAVNANFTILGNYSKYKARQALGTRLRGVPDESWGLYGDYHFTEGALSGFGASVGADYRGDAVGQNASGYTTTRALPGGGFVANQANSKYDGRTLVNVGLYYRTKVWTARVQVANATDEQYIASVLNRTSIGVGEPRSIRGSFSYNY